MWAHSAHCALHPTSQGLVALLRRAKWPAGLGRYPG